MKGVVVRFDPDRGFGFIRAPGVEEDIYINRRDVPDDLVLRPGRRLTFETERTSQGLRARKVQVGRGQLPPELVATGLGLATALLATAVLTVVGLPWLVAWVASISVVTFLAFWWDKEQAHRGGFRVPELSLHTLTLAGGTVGALVARHWLRHKTRKVRFRVVLWTIVAVQVVAVALVLVVR